MPAPFIAPASKLEQQANRQTRIAMTLPKFFIINRSKHRWGDYGDILSQGMANRVGGVVEVQRTGPYRPPLSLPGLGEIIVTETLRQALLKSGLNGFEFETVVKRLIVMSDWEEWDQAADEPAEHSESGEPEDYVLGRPHSFEADERMGNLWSLELNRDAETRREQRIVQHRNQIRLVTSTWLGQDIFCAQDVGFVYVTDLAKEWFEEHVPGRLTFEEAAVTSDV